MKTTTIVVSVVFLISSILPATLNAQWSTDPSVSTPISSQVDLQGNSAVASDGAGGAIFAYTDFSQGNFDIDVQHISVLGTLQWNVPSGQALCQDPARQDGAVITVDGQGGAFIAWTDARDGSGGIYAQHIDAQGNSLWTTNGVQIISSQAVNLALVADGQGGVIVAWNDSRAPLPFSQHGHLCMQHINSSGTADWTSGGVFISDRCSNFDNCKIAADGLHGAIVAWNDRTNSSNAGFWAQHVDQNGSPLNTAGGVRIVQGGAARFSMADDNAGNEIFTWSGGTPLDVHAQRIDITLAALWGSGGIIVCDAPNDQINPVVVSDGSGGGVIAWDDRRDSRQSGVLYAQRISQSGSLLWTANGVAFGANSAKVSAIVSDGSGGVNAAWLVLHPLFSEFGAQHLNGSGIPQWSGMLHTTDAWTESTRPGLASDGSGGLIMGWTNNSFHIGAQYFNATGGFGTVLDGRVSGKVYNDVDNGHTFSPGDYGMQNWTVTLTPASGSPLYGVTDIDGKYTINSVPPGSYTLAEAAQANWTQTAPRSPDNYSVTIGSNGPAIGDEDFGNHASVSVNSLKFDIVPLYPGGLTSPCCGQDMTYLLTYRNTGTVAITNKPRVDIFVSGSSSNFFDYQSSVSIPPVPVTTQPPPLVDLTYALPDPLPPGQSGRIYATIKLNCAPGPGLVIYASSSAWTSTKTYDNLFSYAAVACSHDPNDKEVTPKGCGPQGYVVMDDTLTYRIRFQNDGNAPAHLVVIRDTLDANLDISTVQTIGSSHANFLTVTGRELKWTFPAIELPDSASDELGSQGYVKYRVAPLPGVASGTPIGNRASIYFDLNDPVVTNATLNTIATDPLPVARFTAAVESVYAGNPVNFTYTGGTAGASYSWDFGPGAIPPSSNDQNPSGIIFTRGGRNMVILQTTLSGCSAQYALHAIVVLDTTLNTIGVSLNDRWNLISLPLKVSDNHIAANFLGTASKAFSYDGGYQEQDTLGSGPGYWLKLSGSETMILKGEPVERDTFDVVPGWNLIGSITTPLLASNLSGDSPTTIASNFFGYNHGYVRADTIVPGAGYWVRSASGGKIYLDSSGNLPKAVGSADLERVMAAFGAVRIQDAAGNRQSLYYGATVVKNISDGTFDLPPIPPAGMFDARFADGRMAEILRDGEGHSFPILISSASYPITISWISGCPGLTAALETGDHRVIGRPGDSVPVIDENVSLVLRLASGAAMPDKYSLTQNFPNPFNPVTKIDYSLPEDANVVLKVFNILGQEVMVLVNGAQHAGYETVTFDANAFASGVYLYRIEATSIAKPFTVFVQSRKMLLLR